MNYLRYEIDREANVSIFPLISEDKHKRKDI